MRVGYRRTRLLVHTFTQFVGTDRITPVSRVLEDSLSLDEKCKGLPRGIYPNTISDWFVYCIPT